MGKKEPEHAPGEYYLPLACPNARCKVAFLCNHPRLTASVQVGLEMLRFFVFDEPFTLKLLLEGELDRASLPQYETALHSAQAERGNRKLLVDLKDLTLADSAAEQALLAGSHSELHFVPVGKVAELLREQERRDCREQSSFAKKVACFFVGQYESLARPICVKLFRSPYSES
jgi:hypothetical protein